MCRPNQAEHRELALRILDCIDASDLPPLPANMAQAKPRPPSRKSSIASSFLPGKKFRTPRRYKQQEGSRDCHAGGFRTRGSRSSGRRKVRRNTNTCSRRERSIERWSIIGRLRTDRIVRTDPGPLPASTTGITSAPGHPILGAVVERLPDRIRFGRTFGLANWKWPGLSYCSSLRSY